MNTATENNNSTTELKQSIRFFPSIRKYTVQAEYAETNPETIVGCLTALDTTLETFKHYTKKYPEEDKKVKDLLELISENNERNETNKEENPKPQTAYLMLSTEDVESIRKNLKKKKTFKRKYDGDAYQTTFKMVDGTLTAYDPDFPEGREVKTEESLRDMMSDPKTLTSLKSLLRQCYDEWKTEAGMCICSLYAERVKPIKTHEMRVVTTVILSLACLIARKHDILLVPRPNGRFGMLMGDDVSKEVIGDIIGMLSIGL